MAQNYRNQSGRPGESRRGRYEGDQERDRYRTGGEQYSGGGGDWYNRSRGVTGDRPGGGYSEEFGYRRGRNRDENDQNIGGRNYQSRGSSGANYQSGRSYGGDYDREGQSRFDEGRFDEGNRWQSSGEGEYGSEEFLARNQGTGTSAWQEDENDRGRYFGTGSYIDDGDASSGVQRDFYRARAQQERDFGSYRDRGNTGGGSNYGRSYYGSQSDYGRGPGEESGQWRSQQGDYRNRGNWNYGDPNAGSGSSGGAYGRSSQNYGQNYGGQSYGRNYGSSSSASQSFRGRGPQGYQRSDERLKEMICERLTDDHAIDASNVTVEVTSQVVKLTGTVDDRSTKYEIEELVERMGGVQDIDNQLRVQSGRPGSQQSRGSQGTAGQQPRGGSDWEAGSSSTTATSGRTGTSSGASTTGSPSSGSSTKRN